MKLLWTVVKVALVCALVIPLGIIVLATALGILGALFGIAMFVLRIAVIGLIAWGAFTLLGRLFGGPKPSPRPAEIKSLPPVDPHYEAAMRELDRDLGHANR